MKTQSNRLTFSQQFFIATMLFGLFFGAGNLIFPIFLGSQAGRNVWPAIVGLLITGVGIPLLGVAAQGISRSNGLFDLSHKVGRPYAFFFTCALYLTIGPFFAIPRCATTSFTVGLEQILPHDDKSWLYLLLFSLLFFAVTLVLSLRPGKILTYVGKVLTHTFITQQIWGRSWENDIASLRVFMATLRKKLEQEPGSPQYIQTHIGVGYRMIKTE